MHKSKHDLQLGDMLIYSNSFAFSAYIIVGFESKYGGLLMSTIVSFMPAYQQRPFSLSIAYYLETDAFVKFS